MNIGDKVIIKECHSLPLLVGREAKIVVKMVVDPEILKEGGSYYPLQVLLTADPLTIETPFGKGETKGPFPFREDELELVKETPKPEDLDKLWK